MRKSTGEVKSMELFSSDVDVSDLILKKRYAKAAKILHARLEVDPGKAFFRQQLADVLVLDGRRDEALPILEDLADEFAKNGFAAKAIAVLKKIQRLDSSRASIERKLARLLSERVEEEARYAAFRRPPVKIEKLARKSEAASVDPTEPSKLLPRPPEDEVVIEFDATELEEQAPGLPPEVAAAAISQPSPGARPKEAEVEQWREFGFEPPVSVSLTKTPLFSDLNTNELMAVMEGLSLQTLEAGDIIVSEGEPGESLFILSTGTAKAWVRDASGKAHPIRTMVEGDFFGEVSIMTGRPRTATITAVTACELLELDREAVGSITKRFPRVLEVLKTFCETRIQNPAELQIRLQGAS